MFCTQCGSRIDDDSRFCRACGAAIQRRNVPPAAVPVGDVASAKNAKCPNGHEPQTPEGTEPIGSPSEKEPREPIPVTEASVRKTVAALLVSQPTLPKGIFLFEQAKRALKQIRLEADEVSIAFFGVKSSFSAEGRGIWFTSKGIRYWTSITLTTTRRAAKKRFVAYDTIQTLGVLNEKEEDAHAGDYTLCVNDVPLVSVTLEEGAGARLTQLCDALSPLPFRSLYEEKPIGGIEEVLGDGERTSQRVPWVTCLVFLACIVCFVIQLMGGSFGDEERFRSIVEGFGGSLPIWGPIVTGFLHGGWIHIILNMVCLLQLGFPTEKIVGHWCFLSVYLLTTLGGGLLSLHMNPPETISVGASGGIYGLAGFLAAYGWFRFRDLRTKGELSPVQLRFIWRWVKGVLCFLGANFVAAGKLSRWVSIDQSAHAGGALTGMALGFLVWVLFRICTPRATPKDPSTAD